MSSSVRVCCRIRPAGKNDMGSKEVWKINEDDMGNKSQIVIDQSIHKKSFKDGKWICCGKKGVSASGCTDLGIKKFNMDWCFPPDCSQQDVYDFGVSLLVDEVMKGFNATIFAYGQTGSGKTWSMQGNKEVPEQAGMIPRMVEAIFEAASDDSGDFAGMFFEVVVSYVEIYRDKIKDLLDISKTDLKIRESKAKGIFVDGVTGVCCGSVDEVFENMDRGFANRAVGATKMNEESSRSHAVFIMRINAENEETGKKTSARLMMVDLAGSEKVAKTGAAGTRLNEAKDINKSLSALGNVVRCITEQKGHIPYRDSTLTRLLQPALGGNSKTTIIVTCSPCERNNEETVSTLRFGVNCKKVKNKPTVNATLSVEEYKRKVAALTKKLNNYEKLIQILRSMGCEHLEEAMKAVGSMKDEEKDDSEQVSVGGVKVKTSHISHKGAGPPENGGNSQISAGGGTDIFGNSEQIEALVEKLAQLEDQNKTLTYQLQESKNDQTKLNEKLETAEHIVQNVAQGDNKRKEDEERLNIVELELDALKRKNVGLEKEQQLAKEASMQREAELEFALKREKDRYADAQAGGNFIARDDLPPPSAEEIEIYKKFSPSNALMMTKDDMEWRKTFEAKYRGCHQELMKAMQTIREIKADAADSADMQNMGGAKLRPLVRKLCTKNQSLSGSNTELSDEVERLKRLLTVHQRREKVNLELRQHWQSQVNQLEDAIVLRQQVYDANQTKLRLQVTEKEEELLRLKDFLGKIIKRQDKNQKRKGLRVKKRIQKVKRRAR